MQAGNPKIGGCATFNGVTMINTETGTTATAIRNKNGTITIKYSFLYNKLLNFYKTRIGGFLKRIPVFREILKILIMMVISLAGLFDRSETIPNKRAAFSNLLKAVLTFLVLAGLIFLDTYYQIAIVLVLLGIFRNRIKVLFMYHGAEHKSISMFENLGYVPDNPLVAQGYSRIHLRCGTNIAALLLPIFAIYSVFIESFLESLNLYLDLVCSLILVGLIMEIFQQMQKRNLNWLFLPGLTLQKYITTKEPSDENIETAIAALKAVLKQ